MGIIAKKNYARIPEQEIKPRSQLSSVGMHTDI